VLAQEQNVNQQGLNQEKGTPLTAEADQDLDRQGLNKQARPLTSQELQKSQKRQPSWQQKR
jgi:hypothetical protein